MHHVQNPILPGFNPDPSICRVGDDYYIATSTFEWYPGVQIHHSRDLKHWHLVHRPLCRPDLLNMLGNPDSCGVWAPCLTWDDGLFYLVFTDVKRFDGNFKDTHNYLTTCETIDGDWSTPVYLNSSGFDPSLFHDDDGRKWLTNMVWDHRPDRTFFEGIVLQEYSVAEQRLAGARRMIFAGTELDCTEAPHIYKHEGRYYLMTAEGGTGYDHAVTMARADRIEGPYMADPAGPVLTSAHAPAHALQRAGHGDFIRAANGEHYLAHLTSRPLSANLRRSPLGRETALQKVIWTEDGWLRMASGGQLPEQTIAIEGIEEHPWPLPDERVEFRPGPLPPVLQWLRTPYPERIFSLGARPGYLRLYGREAIGSWFTQALVARRFEHHAFYAETQVEFAPESYQQMAGLTCYYNASKFHYLYISHDLDRGRHLGLMSCEADASLAVTFPLWDAPVPLPEHGPVRLGVTVDGETLSFCWAHEDGDIQAIGPELDASLLADEAGKGEGAQFTGAFVGLCAQDITGQGCHADFAYLIYRPAAE